MEVCTTRLANLPVPGRVDQILPEQPLIIEAHWSIEGLCSLTKSLLNNALTDLLKTSQ